MIQKILLTLSCISFILITGALSVQWSAIDLGAAALEARSTGAPIDVVVVQNYLALKKFVTVFSSLMSILLLGFLWYPEARSLVCHLIRRKA